MAASLKSPTIKLLIVDDHPVVREGLSSMLNKQPGIRVIGAAFSGDNALAQLAHSACDVVLLDLRMPEMSGIETLHALSNHGIEAKTIILSSFEVDEEIYRAVEAGAKGYLLKDSTCEEIVDGIRAVYEGRLCFPERIEARLSQRKTRPDISPRELDVLELMAKGLTNKEIAHVLKISQYTVRNHINHISEKLKVSDRTEAAVLAIHMGLIATT